MSTIKDIAREAGVSIATVSIVLNGKGRERKISQETQDRIHQIAQQLKYVPNQSAKKLRAAHKDSYAIAFYWATDFRINYLARITLGIQREIMRQNKVVHLTVVPYEVDHLQKQMETTRNEFFNGIIIANMSDKDMEYLNSCDLSCPVVLFNRESPKYSSVTMDNYEVGCRVARHFLKKGLYDAGVLTHDTAFPIMRTWMDGFIDTFARAGHPIPQDRICLCTTSSASAIEATRQLAETHRLPRAMFCESDVLAHGMLYACHEMGISIPGDVEVFTIGINMAEFNDYAIPSLSRIDIPMGHIGEQLLHLIVNLIEKKAENPTVQYVDGIEIIAQSSPAENS
ncbi:LacI family DNA-binding transcriptional regulator [uncultured Megasphaera sp.]|uniref:LacI family DNA-binding transcriptional regulator n=1 Tax=uncultured Megasphaera sp. TaxID=165188 RepID=UPI002658D42D|nr:LacI family DNA-binding transcriptional regulator [uncultured Megasphaera sp.]